MTEFSCSQESDICQADDMDAILADQQVRHAYYGTVTDLDVIENVDWSAVPVPDPQGGVQTVDWSAVPVPVPQGGGQNVDWSAVPVPCPQGGGQNVDWSAVPVLANALNPTGELPARNEWPGDHKFDVKLDVTGVLKKHCVMSTKLNKVFVNLEHIAPFEIKWDGTPGLSVRALMLYTEADKLKTPVMRCANHKDKDINPNHPGYEHVLTCENDNAQYVTDEHSLRHSVLVPLHLQQGAQHALVNYKFMCMTTCSSLNRAQTDVIFTLEDPMGTVLGRQKVAVKICASPKRDKGREEEILSEQSGKRKMAKKDDSLKAGVPTITNKKIKTEYDPNNQSFSFMVTVINADVAQQAKAMIQKWSDVKALEWAPEGTIPTPLVLEITDEVANPLQPNL